MSDGEVSSSEEDGEATVDDALQVLEENDGNPRLLLEHDELRSAIAEWKHHDDPSVELKYEHVKEAVNWRGETMSKGKFDDLVDKFHSENKNTDDETSTETLPDDPPDPSERVHWESVSEAAERLFDARSRDLVEAFATVFVRMMFDGVSDCPIMVGKGVAAGGKSTLVEVFPGIDHAQRHDIITSRAFVSHSTDAEQGANDLLPAIKQRTLLAAELNPWFTGDNVDDFMSRFSRISDGNGYVKSSGAQGTTGYEADYPGEYRFGLVGAVTPLSKQAWVALGNAGSRFIFHPMPREDDLETLRKTLNNGKYTAAQEQLRDQITDWWRTMWHTYDGEITEDDWPEITEAQDRAIMLLANLLARGRAVDYGGDDTGTAVETAEQESRIYWMFKRIVIARALMYERDHLEPGDMEMIARCAFASMPQWRKPTVKLMTKPGNTGPYRSDRVQAALNVSRKTALKRMKEMGRIGLADVSTEAVQGGQNTVMELANSKHQGMFEQDWHPDNLSVPWPFDN